MDKLVMEEKGMVIKIDRRYPCDRRNYAAGRGGEAIRYLVIHYVGALGGARANAQYYGSARVGASAHYFVGHASEGAAIYASVPEADTAWHCGGGLQGPTGHTLHGICRNANSIGVELCCHQDETGRWYFDPETVDRGVELVSYLMARHGIPAERVVRHYDVTGKICPAPYVLNEAAWARFKARLEEGDMEQSRFNEMFLTAMQAYREGLRDNDSGDWSEEARAFAVEQGFFTGSGAAPDGQPNLMWEDFLTREQAALLLYRFAKRYGLA